MSYVNKHLSFIVALFGFLNIKNKNKYRVIGTYPDILSKRIHSNEHARLYLRIYSWGVLYITNSLA